MPYRDLTLARPAGPLRGYLWALLLTAAAAVVAVGADRWLPISNLSLVFVLPVVVAAVRLGLGPAMAAAALGVAAVNFLLITPRYTFRVAEAADVWALALLMIIGAIVSAVAAQSRRRAVEAIEHAGRSEALGDLARALVAATDGSAIAEAAAQSLKRLFGVPAVVLVEADQSLSRNQAAGDPVSDADLDAARWSLASRLPTRAGAYPAEAARYDFWPVVTPSRRQAVLGVEISGRDEGRPAAPERLVDMVGAYLAIALDREHHARQALDARVEAESQRLKSDLVAAVSHDLRTPLSTILFTLQSLQRFADVHDPAARAELLALAEAETARLSGLVANLLDMSRIDAGAVTVRVAPLALADLVAGALERVRSATSDRRLSVDVPPDLRVRVDPGLAETALANVIDNAAKYSPAGSLVAVAATVDGDMAVLSVTDEGPGFPDEADPLFEKFVRGVEGDGRPPGVGLGLSIARGFLRSFGGTIEAGPRAEGRGAAVRLRLPLDAA